MKAKKGEWFSLQWDIIDFHDPQSFEQHKNAPRFLYAKEDSNQIESEIINKLYKLRLVSIFLTTVFINEANGVKVPTHYRVGEFMPGDKPSYDRWLAEHHQINYSVVEQIRFQEALQQKKVFLEHTAKIIRHDMHSGINTYIPRGLKGLLKRLPPETIKKHKINGYIKMLEEGLNYTQKVYRGVYAFTNLVKEDSVLEKQKCNLKEIIEDFIKGSAYEKQVSVDELIDAEVEPTLFCTAIDNLIKGGLKFNKSENRLVKIYMQDEFTLCIQDNGVGLSKEDFLLYCKPYIRKETSSHAPKGLELNIAVSILEYHEFFIEPEKIDNGTIFRINLNTTEQKQYIIDNTFGDKDE
jgi:signal transduction histidine kinase